MSSKKPLSIVLLLYAITAAPATFAAEPPISVLTAGGSSVYYPLGTALGNAIANAGDLLGTAAPRVPVGAPRQGADVSSSVIVTLLVVLAAGGLFVVWSRRPGWFRPRRLRSGALR